MPGPERITFSSREFGARVDVAVDHNSSPGLSPLCQTPRH
jgi:hypothetical protein